MNFCSGCGGPVSKQIPAGDTRERFVCDRCGTIHYQNPKVVTGCLPIWEDRVLLCRRAIQPKQGLWTLPAGFLETGETTQQGAERETWEEACAKVDVQGPYTFFNLPHISQIYIFFRAHLIDGEFGIGAESSDAKLFYEAEIPWDELAFPVVENTLRHYFYDRGTGAYPVRMEDIIVTRPPL